MTFWPEPEKTKIPEGHYKFRIYKEPELKKFTYRDKKGQEKEGRRLILYAIGLGEQGEFSVMDSFLPWEDRYIDLCKALKVEHGRDIEVSGNFFEADIKHEADRNDPKKSYVRIINIVIPAEEEGDDVPF